MKNIVLIFFVTTLYSDIYDNLRIYKGKNPSISQTKKEGEFLVRFKNINKFNFYEFEKKYNVNFTFCIADGICAFKPISQNKIGETLIRMKEREDLISVDIYKKYNMSNY